MMDKVYKLLDLVTSEMKKEDPDFNGLDNGEEVAAVFNDGVLIIGMEDNELKVKIILGEPVKIDYTLGFAKEV